MTERPASVRCRASELPRNPLPPAITTGEFDETATARTPSDERFKQPVDNDRVGDADLTDGRHFLLRLLT